MKLFSLLLSAFTLLVVTTIAQQPLPGEYNGQVTFVSSPSPGTITVHSVGFAKKKLESNADALATAFYTLMFRGIAGSQYNLPIVPDENEKKNNKTIIALLNGGYNAFITGKTIISEQKTKRKADGVKGISTTHEITIDCEALRRHLEQNNVIRKFGI